MVKFGSLVNRIQSTIQRKKIIIKKKTSFITKAKNRYPLSMKTNIPNCMGGTLNVDFQNSFPNLIKKNFMDTLEIRVWGERRPKDRVTLQLISVFTLALTHPKTFT
jgi:hypothetical protein